MFLFKIFRFSLMRIEIEVNISLLKKDLSSFEHFLKSKPTLLKLCEIVDFVHSNHKPLVRFIFIFVRFF